MQYIVKMCVRKYIYCIIIDLRKFRLILINTNTQFFLKTLKKKNAWNLQFKINIKFTHIWYINKHIYYIE